MSDERDMLVAAATRLMRDLCTCEDVRTAERTGWAPNLWSALSEAGFPLVGVDEAAGGAGGDLADACALLHVAGTFAAPVPLAETGMLGGWALVAAGLPLPGGPVTVAPGARGDELDLRREGGSWHVRGRVHRVAWASYADVVVVLGQSDGRQHVIALPRGSFDVTSGHNLAGEPRDTLSFGTTVDERYVAPAPPGVDREALALRGALSRCALMAGAMARVSVLSGRYTSEREQFGRPIARFQAVQQHLVRIAEQAQAAHMATTAAAQNGVRQLDLFDVAAAKIVCGDAATVVTAASHQAHGAIGMTREYELAQLTRRLWSWREEYGGEAHWSRVLGRQVAAAGADGLWPRVSTGLLA